MSLKNQINEIFPHWIPYDNLPIDSKISSGNSELYSYMWKSEEIDRARLCVLDIKEKFTAETLVIYPTHNVDIPILGTEYISVAGKKFFGAIDFHPLTQDPEYSSRYVEKYLHDLPDREVETSKFYDLSQFFSSKFWIRKSFLDFYNDYSAISRKFLERYKLLLSENKSDSKAPIYLPLHINYDQHMGKNDPAHGILKAYFSKSFADFYINDFLFGSKQN